MSPVLPRTTPRFIPRRRLARRPAVSFLPFTPAEPNPKSEAGALAQGDSGWCQESLESPSADCPPRHLSRLPGRHWWA